MSPWWRRLRCRLFGHPTPALGVLYTHTKVCVFDCHNCGARWGFVLDD